MKRYLNYCVFTLLLCWFYQALAVQVSNLYTVSVPVASQSANNRQQGLIDALKQVLVKVSGTSSILQAENIQSILPDASDYVQQYSYQTKKVLGDNSLLMLQTVFEPKAINELIKQSGQTLWGRNRPLVLAWLAVKTGSGDIHLQAADKKSQVKELFRQDAANRGLPILFPMVDLTDLQNISAADVFYADTLAVVNASKRYFADAILIAQIQQIDNIWHTNWQLVSDNQQFSGQYQAATLDQVMLGLVNHVTDTLAVNYSVSSVATQKSHVLLTVIAVNNLINYAKVTNYLNDLTPVKDVEIAEVGNDRVTFDLTVVGGKTALVKALSLDHTLKPIPNTNAMNQNQQSSQLFYQWML